MGCDIHCFIEYKLPSASYWSDFGGRINPGRNYLMFGAMAGVRVEDIPHVKPRGVAENMAYEAMGEYSLFVWGDEDEGDSISVARAQGLIQRYGMKPLYSGELHGNRIPHPDWHSHSWLDADEFEAAILVRTAIRPSARPIPEYKAMLAAMRSFEDEGCESRLVFWFDN